MVKLVDRTGQQFGRLTVVAQAGRNNLKKVLWDCVCACGARTTVASGSLVTGNTTSCGCVLKEAITKHGNSGKSSYNTWRAMVRRCNNPEDKDYGRYGGKGIRVCERWLTYENFVTDMGEPEGSQTLDRKDPYGNYEPDNCRWASLSDQARNHRLHANNRSGFTGVYTVYEEKWMARISNNKKVFYSKVCKTFEEAVLARKGLEQVHWGANKK